VTTTAGCGRFVTESAHGVRPTSVIVAPEGGGQEFPSLGRGYAVDRARTDVFGIGSAR